MGCCDASAIYPDPNDRKPGGPSPVNAGRGGSGGSRGSRGSRGYRRFYSARLDRISRRIADIVATPSLLRLREVAMAAVAVYALYRGFFVATSLHMLLLREPVTLLCRGNIAPLGCGWRYLTTCLRIVLSWVMDVGTWQMTVGVVVFFIEEAMMRAFSVRL